MDRLIVEKETIKCPFCGKGDIELTRTSEYYSINYARAFGKIKRIPVVHPERVDIHNECLICKKSKKEIKEALIKGKKPLSHEERLKLWKKRGLLLVLGSE